MKILHTADWHLGAKTDKRSRFEEQQRVMREIAHVADEEKVDIVLICGDVFDQAIPTSEAENLFFNTIEQLSGNDNRVVIALAGNHDDPRRLEANTHFAKKHNIVLAGDLNPICQPNPNSRVKIVDFGKGFIQITMRNHRNVVENCVVAILPYPVEYRLKEKSTADDYAGKVAEWSRLVAKGFKNNCFNIFASHLMITGSCDCRNGKNEVLKIGDINSVDRSDLPRADYYALGHLHNFQIVKKDSVYPGAPLFYSYNQQDAGVVICEADNSGLKKIKFRKLDEPCKMASLRVESIEEANKELTKFSDNDLVELTFVMDKPISSVEHRVLREKFPCIMQIRLELTNLKKDPQEFVSARKQMSPSELFTNFYRKKKLGEPQKELLELFVDIMEDNRHETN